MFYNLAFQLPCLTDAWQQCTPFAMDSATLLSGRAHMFQLLGALTAILSIPRKPVFSTTNDRHLVHNCVWGVLVVGLLRLVLKSALEWRDRGASANKNIGISYYQRVHQRVC